jgi:hypothetical protein
MMLCGGRGVEDVHPRISNCFITVERVVSLSSLRFYRGSFRNFPVISIPPLGLTGLLQVERYVSSPVTQRVFVVDTKAAENRENIKMKT